MTKSLSDKLITKDFFIIEKAVTIGKSDVKFMMNLLHLLQLYANKAVIGQQVVYFLSERWLAEVTFNISRNLSYIFPSGIVFLRYHFTMET